MPLRLVELLAVLAAKVRSSLVMKEDGPTFCSRVARCATTVSAILQPSIFCCDFDDAESSASGDTAGGDHDDGTTAEKRTTDEEVDEATANDNDDDEADCLVVQR